MILAFDTTLGTCSVALIQDGEVLSFSIKKIGRGHAEILFPMIEGVLKSVDKNLSEVDTLGVTVGPGSFTGVRVAISAAKGLSYGLKIPIKTVSSLEAITFEPLDNNSIKKGAQIAAIVDARRGEVYAQRFKCTGHGLRLKTESEPEVISLEQLKIWGDYDFEMVVCSPTLGEECFENWKLSNVIRTEPDARFIGKELESYKAKEGGFTLKPIYLRAPDAVKMKPHLGLEL